MNFEISGGFHFFQEVGTSLFGPGVPLEVGRVPRRGVLFCFLARSPRGRHFRFIMQVATSIQRAVIQRRAIFGTQYSTKSFERISASSSTVLIFLIAITSAHLHHRRHIISFDAVCIEQ